jgi:hypothetical protein
MILKRSSQASETFVVAHRGRFARDDRRHLPFEIGLELWHRITSRESGIIENLRRISHFGVSWRQDWQPCHAATSGWRFSFREKPGNSLPHRAIEATPEARQNPAISRFASPGGFVIRRPLRTPFYEPWGFALFLGSSAVEHSTVNRMVAGSNPARGAKKSFSRSLATNEFGIVASRKRLASLPAFAQFNKAGRHTPIDPC